LAFAAPTTEIVLGILEQIGNTIKALQRGGLGPCGQSPPNETAKMPP